MPAKPIITIKLTGGDGAQRNCRPSAAHRYDKILNRLGLFFGISTTHRLTIALPTWMLIVHAFMEFAKSSCLVA